jgi:hypothetical protein
MKIRDIKGIKKLSNPLENTASPRVAATAIPHPFPMADPRSSFCNMRYTIKAMNHEVIKNAALPNRVFPLDHHRFHGLRGTVPKVLPISDAATSLMVRIRMGSRK